jgi:hypothetical protein
MHTRRLLCQAAIVLALAAISAMRARPVQAALAAGDSSLQCGDVCGNWDESQS